jgi:site-specific recombinase XerD
MPLVEEGKVSQYLKPYATRKTFITRQLQNGVDPKTVAYWVGDNVDTIMEYYSDINREAVPV